MKKIFKYVSALALTGVLAMMLSGNVYAQHRGGGGSHGGGGFHGASRGGGGYHGSVRSGGGFHGAVGTRGAVGARGYANRGAIGARGYANRGGVGVRGGIGARGYANRGGRYSYGGRTYFRGGYGYRGYGGFRFGFGWGYPHFGLYFNLLPYGYYPFYWNSLPYYYSGGVFYRPYNGGYEVSAPPLGASVPNLPSDAQSIVIDGIQYYEANGVYYQPDVDDSGKTIYVVVGRDGVLNTDNGGGSQPATGDNYDPASANPQANSNAQVQQNQNPPQVQTQQGGITLKVGDNVDKLPDDCRKVTINKKKYYVSPDNIFFEEYSDASGSGYKVASVPAPGQTQDSNQ
jgi:hypothetical protein